MNKEKCPNCNGIFECKNSSDCWCTSVPKLPECAIDSQKCLCKDCLDKKYREYLQSNVSKK
jgi:hypothetical protein